MFTAAPNVSQNSERPTSEDVGDLLDQLKGHVSELAEYDDLAEVTDVIEAEHPTEIGDGWRQRRMFGSDDFDMWMRIAERGDTMPPHRYPDHCLTLLMIEGAVELVYGPADNEKTARLGENLEVFQVHQGTRHHVKALTDARMVTIFRPPISRTPDTSASS